MHIFLVIAIAVLSFDFLLILVSFIGYLIRKKLSRKNARRQKDSAAARKRIDEIHARGKITPEEKVMEWEAMELCAPGDAIGSASWRCEKYGNCHECLTAYATELNTEFESIFTQKNLNFHL